MMCEHCSTKIKFMDGFWGCIKSSKEWYFLCGSCQRIGEEIYTIRTADVFKSPTKTISWLAIMHEARWFAPGAFSLFMHRLAAQGGGDD